MSGYNSNQSSELSILWTISLTGYFIQLHLVQVIEQKSKISYDELTTKLCPVSLPCVCLHLYDTRPLSNLIYYLWFQVLSIHQLYKLCTFYSHDNDDTDSVSPEVRIKLD